jgi:hypothetical protein
VRISKTPSAPHHRFAEEMKFVASCAASNSRKSVRRPWESKLVSQNQGGIEAKRRRKE